MHAPVPRASAGNGELPLRLSWIHVACAFPPVRPRPIGNRDAHANPWDGIATTAPSFLEKVASGCPCASSLHRLQQIRRTAVVIDLRDTEQSTCQQCVQSKALKSCGIWFENRHARENGCRIFEQLHTCSAEKRRDRTRRIRRESDRTDGSPIQGISTLLVPRQALGAETSGGTAWS